MVVSEVLISSLAAALVMGGAFMIGANYGVLDDEDARPTTTVASVGGAVRGAAAGESAYLRRCAGCHGPTGRGSRIGPPLTHPSYDIRKHGDLKFQAAIRLGAPQRRWRYGPMPAMKAMSQREVSDIVAHVMALQGAAR